LERNVNQIIFDNKLINVLMKKFISFTFLLLLGGAFVPAKAQKIYEIYSSGGIAGGTWGADYVVLSGFSPNQSVTGMSLQTASTSVTWTAFPLTGNADANGFFRIWGNASVTTRPWVPEMTAGLNMTNTNSGQVALMNTTTATATGTCPSGVTLLDLVGYVGVTTMTNSTCYEGGGSAPLTNGTGTQSRRRINETNNNNTDFVVINNPYICTTPTAFTATGGGAICSGGSGVAIGLSGSETGVSYQLMNGAANAGSAVNGTGAALNFGNQTVAGTYKVLATKTTGGCFNMMNSSATISINPSVTPTVSISASPSGAIILGTSVQFTALPTNGGASPSYQWKKNNVNVGTNNLTYTDAALANGDKISVVMTSNAACVSPNTATSNEITMSVTTNSFVTINNGCFNGIVLTRSPTDVNGKPVWTLSNLNVTLGGMSYPNTTLRLYFATSANVNTTNNPSISSPGRWVIATGTGTTAILYQPTSTANLPPATGWVQYDTSPSLSCSNASSTVLSGDVSDPCINPIPYDINGGGSYCAGQSGVAIGLSNSQTGVTYQLKIGASNVGSPVNGTGAAISFVNQTVAGTYTVVATRTVGGCTSNMNGSVTVSISPNTTPSVSISANPSGAITAGTSVQFGALPTNGGAIPSYQWQKNNLNVGTNSPNYTDAALANGDKIKVVMTSNAACPSPATATSNEITMTVNPAPWFYDNMGLVTTGVASLPWVNSSTACNPPGAINQGVVVNSNVGSANWFGGWDGVSTGATAVEGALCWFGQTPGNPPVNVAGSTFVNYTYTINVTGIATITSLTFGMRRNTEGHPNLSTFTINGTPYTPSVTNLSTTNWTANSLTFSPAITVTKNTLTIVIGFTGGNAATNSGFIQRIDELKLFGSILRCPTAYTVTGGGTVCPNSVGVPVGVSNSETGMTYQLKNGAANVGSPVNGTGSAISFGNQLADGNYTVVATATSGGCTTNMTGSANVVVVPNTRSISTNITTGSILYRGGQITATNQISNATVEYRATQFVQLNPGFSAAGNTFLANIAACN
jgi:hypothetical protein